MLEKQCAIQKRSRQIEQMLAEEHCQLDLATFDRLLHTNDTIIQPGG